MTVVDRVELFFKMDFNSVINILHIEKEISLSQLAKECGVSRQAITNVLKSRGLLNRNVKEAAAVTKNKGPNHWAYGLSKETSEWAKNVSDRMKKNNPSKCISARENRAIAVRDSLIKRKLPQELEFCEVLKSLNVDFIEQHPLGPYNIDFFIPKLNICIEIDSCHKWGESKRNMAKKRDEYILSKYNAKTIRINKLKIKDLLFITNILNSHNII